MIMMMVNFDERLLPLSPGLITSINFHYLNSSSLASVSLVSAFRDELNGFSKKGRVGRAFKKRDQLNTVLRKGLSLSLSSIY